MYGRNWGQAPQAQQAQQQQQQQQQQFPPGPRPGPAGGGGGGGGPGPGGPGPQHPAAGGGGPPGQHPGAPGGGQMSEMDMLRRTLFEFLTENEALRSALHESNMPMEPRGGAGPGGFPPGHPGAGGGGGGGGPGGGGFPPNMNFPPYGHPSAPAGVYGELDLMDRARAGGENPGHYNPQAHAAQHYAANARHIAVERYRAKRKRRLEAPNLNGPRYEKMKAVADGKQRNSSGKFVKKIKPLANGDENLALEAPHTEQAEPVVQKHQMESHEERQHEDQDNEQQKDKEENVQDANAEGNDE